VQLSRLKAAVFGLVTALVVLAILEGASRLMKPIEYPPDPLITEDFGKWADSREYDALLFWKLPANRPNWAGGGTNSLGLRGPEIPPKQDREFRVLSLGESTTFGWRIPVDACYSSLLENELRRRIGGNIRVINAGVPGYTVLQGMVYLRIRGIELNPDAVLVYFGFNDFLDVAYRERRDYRAGSAAKGLTDRELYDERRRPLARLTDWLYRSSNLARLLGSRLHPRTMQVPGQTEEESLPSTGIQAAQHTPRVPEEDRWAALEEIYRVCQANGIDLVVVIPWYRAFAKHAALLRSFAEKNPVGLVDLPAILESVPEPITTYFIDGVHPTAAGHQQIASAIADVVGERWSALIDGGELQREALEGAD